MLTKLCYPGHCHHICTRDPALTQLQGGPEGTGALPRKPLQDLLFNALEVLHYVASQPVLDSNKDLNNLVEIERGHIECLQCPGKGFCWTAV